MRTVVIGGTGHVGSYLVPRLVAAGCEVVQVSRGQHRPYKSSGLWRQVTTVTVDRDEQEAAGTFGERIAALDADVVIDLICFRQDSARQLVEALSGRIQHLLHCGTLWVHGPSAQVPTTETQPRSPIDDYGRHKAEIETYLLDQARRHRFPATVLHPGHITGPGWAPINPVGNLDVSVLQRLADGNEVTLPNFGMETLQHVHADDVAQAFMAALGHHAASVGESFHVAASTAVTMRGYAEAVAAWFGRDPYLAFLPWEQWRETVDPEHARQTYSHLAHSPHCSIAKAHRTLGYQPRYSVLDATADAIDGLMASGEISASKD